MLTWVSGEGYEDWKVAKWLAMWARRSNLQANRLRRSNLEHDVDIVAESHENMGASLTHSSGVQLYCRLDTCGCACIPVFILCTYIHKMH